MTKQPPVLTQAAAHRAQRGVPVPLAAPLPPLGVPLGLVVLVAPEVPVEVLVPGVVRLRFCSVTEPEPDSEPEPLVLPVAVQPARMPSASRAVPMRKGVFMLSSIWQVGGKPCCVAQPAGGAPMAPLRGRRRN
ncbi:hypothetical protein [Cupriavidus neocaledonicus]|uniref:Uncharacterized protein n=1 Tax=Cupriavidus neocaledonicus TaxID=1040979 RepID=A0A375HND9_9BURK|nr:hypothetical protein [Cupriavidus neocaledonicus]SOZ38603.1 conserved hypothetical protein [Cupriavidus neocaledonicus]SPD59751.1 conserved protein of unknown function [Cupriavidus neocaledonicus]